MYFLNTFTASVKQNKNKNEKNKNKTYLKLRKRKDSFCKSFYKFYLKLVADICYVK